MSAKKLVARFALVAAVLFGAWWMSRAWPVEIEVVYELGDRRLSAMDVEFVQDGELARRTEFRWSAPPETRPRHTVRLRPGDYTLRIVLHTAAGERLRSENYLTVDRATEQVVIRAGDGAATRSGTRP